MYSSEVKRVKADITANLKFLTFLQRANKKPNGKSDRSTIGTLALHSETLPNILKDKHSSQKKSGGFSKKYSPLRYRVKKSPLLSISFDISTYLVSSTSKSGYEPRNNK